MNLSKEQIHCLQSKKKNIRNICILAHVDHGKTTLSDSLIASNGIISKRLAGKIRYLDSRQDEQIRGITMESSAISLFFKTIDQSKQINQYLINLIDSPGHIDFSSEVSTSSRLCDGAIVLIDVVEGICSQTITVLRQAWIDNLKPILVLNKIDRLITELQFSSEDAYIHLEKIIQQTNAIIASFYNGDMIKDHFDWNGDEGSWIEKNDDDIYFSTSLNNVIFTSAMDGWGFNINQFAVILSKKLDIEKSVLEEKLWGNFYFDFKTKRILDNNKNKKKLKPMFVTFIFDSIWKIYSSSLEKDIESIEKITKSLNIKLSAKDLNSKDSKYLINVIMSQWLPISNSILLSIIDKLPSPITSQYDRIPAILKSSPNSELVDERLKSDMINCNENGLTSVYISKMVSVPENELPENQPAALSKDELFERGRIARLKAVKAAEMAAKLEEKNSCNDNDRDDDKGNGNKKDEYEIQFGFDEGSEEKEEEETKVNPEILIAFSRIYSGTLTIGQELSLLSPLYDPSDPGQYIHKVKIEKLYLIMGRELISLDTVSAGNIVGIYGSSISKHIIKSGTLISPDIVGINLSGIVLDLPPIVKVSLEPNELKNMDKLINGLKLLNLSDPCVKGFINENGELILETAGELHLERCIKDLKERFAGVEFNTGKPIVPFRETFIGSNNGVLELGNWKIHLKLSPLNYQITKFLSNNKKVSRDNKTFKNLLIDGGFTEKSIDGILSVNTNYPNILVDLSTDSMSDFKFTNNLINGFQLSVNEGPLMGEPIQGACVTIESIENAIEEGNSIDPGRLITSMRDKIHEIFLKSSPRIMLAMYIVEIQTSAEILGKVYSVIQRKKGQIISEEMKEGTPFFNVTAKLPVMESFGFSEDIRKKTSGNAIPQLRFDGFEMIELDPFWVPTTEEELEELGEKGDKENTARLIMNNVRRNKGLFVDEKVVENAEKQRTLKKD